MSSDTTLIWSSVRELGKLANCHCKFLYPVLSLPSSTGLWTSRIWQPLLFRAVLLIAPTSLRRNCFLQQNNRLLFVFIWCQSWLQQMTFIQIFSLFFRENKTWCFKWILCCVFTQHSLRNAESARQWLDLYCTQKGQNCMQFWPFWVQ